MSARKHRRSRRPFLVAAAILLAAMALAAGFWWSRPGKIPLPPTVDLTGADPAIRRAVESARTAVLEHGSSAEAWGRLGMVLVGHGLSVEDAEICLAQAERLDPRQPRWPYLQAIAVISMDPELAITKFRRAVELCDGTPDVARSQLGELFIDQGRWDEAKEQFLRILQVQPGNARAHLGLARVLVEQGQLSDSVAHLTRCAADPHTRKAASTLLAQVYGRLGNPSAAEQALRQVGELPKDAEWVDPFQDKVHELQVGQQTALVRADSLINQGRYSDAARLLQQTVQDYPNSASGWMMLGRAWIGGKDPVTAERSLRKAIELDAAMADAQFYLGVALFLQKKHAAAAAYFRQAVELKPDFAQAHLDLGHCLREQGDDSGAIAAFRMAIQQKPDYAAAHFNLAALLLKRGQREEALIHLRQAVRLNPADRGARWLLDQALKQTTGPAGM